MSFLNGKQLFGLAIKVSWANATGHYNIFVGDLSSVVTNDMLLACFSVYPSCSGARVMWDQKTGRSRGFGFVSFRNQQVLTSIVQENRLVVGRSVVTGLQKVLELMMTSRALMPKVWGSYQMAFQHKKIRMLAGRLESMLGGRTEVPDERPSMKNWLDCISACQSFVLCSLCFVLC